MIAPAALHSRRVFAARRFTPAVEAALRDRYHLAVNADDRVLSPEGLEQAAQDCDYLLVSVTERLPAGAIGRLRPRLRAIATLSVGVDHIDLQAAREAGVAVLHTPDVLSEACAEIAMLLILNAARRGGEGDRMVRSGDWKGWSPTLLLGQGLVGRRLGILGLGRIGREVAKRAASFGMAISYHSRTRLAAGLEQGALYHDTAEGLLEASEVLCICAPGGPGMTHFLNAERIALMPHGAIVVNVSRGDLVDDDALIAALGSGRLFAAGLDVFGGEPDIDPRYRALPNVFLTPHIGSATTQTRDSMGFLLLDGLKALEEGRPSANRLC